jgi:hypothetical protein
MEAEGSLLCSQELATSTYPEPDQCSPVQFFEIPCFICKILWTMQRRNCFGLQISLGMALTAAIHACGLYLYSFYIHLLTGFRHYSGIM